MTSALQRQRRRPGKVLRCCYVAGNSSNHSDERQMGCMSVAFHSKEESHEYAKAILTLEGELEVL